MLDIGWVEQQRDWLEGNGLLRRRVEDMPQYGVDAQEQHDWLNAGPQMVLEEDYPHIARALAGRAPDTPDSAATEP